MSKIVYMAIEFKTDGLCQVTVLRENGEDCLLASVARLTETRESFYVAVFCFVALPPGDEFSHGQVAVHLK